MKNHANVTLKSQLQAAPGTELHKFVVPEIIQQDHPNGHDENI